MRSAFLYTYMQLQVTSRSVAANFTFWFSFYVVTIWVDCVQSSQNIQTPKISWGSCPRNYHWSMKSNRALNEIQVTFIHSRADLVALTSECGVKSLDWDIGKQCIPDQTPQNAASDQGLHCFLKLQDVKDKMKQFKIPVQDHFPNLSKIIDLPVLSVLWFFYFVLIFAAASGLKMRAGRS